MKTGRSLSELAAEVERQSQSKHDYIADTRALSLRPVDGEDGKPDLLLDGVNGGMQVGPMAHSQFSSVLSIPKKYYDRMLEQAPDLLAQNVNHWLRTDAKKKMIRTLDNRVRAVLSDKYRPLDNIDLLQAVLPQVSQSELRVESCEVTERRLWLKAVSERVTGDIKVGDSVYAGVVISNSEVGFGSLNVEELDWRKVCANGMISASLIRKTHIGRSASRNLEFHEEAQEFFTDRTRELSDAAFWHQVNDAVTAAFDQERFNARLTRYMETAEHRIESTNIPEVVEAVSSRFNLNEDESGGILRHLIEGGDLSQWGLANAITRTAQDDEIDYERATELESIGAGVIELSPKDWRTVSAN